ncbi:MAG TPA: DUF1775 domain-containing protein [Solirubrobacteraceae bacterium]|nr:DUF1775 domain-containing protein [Solirubrobacteraceae bacterium]
MSRSPARRSLAAAGAVALAAALAGPAMAHVQIAPTVVAPNDPVKFTVLVPGERDTETTKVDMKMPSGLLPFSYEQTPGWKRQLVKASNGEVEQIVWTGRLARDGFVEFSFLAGTPPHPGELAFKALQTYSDGTVVRWIGAPESEHPAPVTRIVAGATRENAGGEGQKASGASSTVTPVAAKSSSASVGADWTARALGIASLAAICGLGFVSVRQRRRDRGGRP